METPKKFKPRNKVAISPLLNKGHAHQSKKDYLRQKEKQKMRQEILQEFPKK